MATKDNKVIPSIVKTGFKRWALILWPHFNTLDTFKNHLSIMNDRYESLAISSLEKDNISTVDKRLNPNPHHYIYIQFNHCITKRDFSRLSNNKESIKVTSKLWIESIDPNPLTIEQSTKDYLNYIRAIGIQEIDGTDPYTTYFDIKEENEQTIDTLTDEMKRYAVISEPLQSRHKISRNPVTITQIWNIPHEAESKLVTNQKMMDIIINGEFRDFNQQQRKIYYDYIQEIVDKYNKKLRITSNNTNDNMFICYSNQPLEAYVFEFTMKTKWTHSTFKPQLVQYRKIMYDTSQLKLDEFESENLDTPAKLHLATARINIVSYEDNGTPIGHSDNIKFIVGHDEPFN